MHSATKALEMSADQVAALSRFEDIAVHLKGAERGTNTHGDIITMSADGRDLSDLWDEFQATIALQNQRRQTLVEFLTFPVVNVIEDVPQFASVDFEEASEFGEPVGVRQNMSVFSLAYDFKWYDIAERFTWKFLADATASQITAVHASVLEADNKKIFQKVMKTVFSNVNSNSTIKGQNYTVYKFYNADGTVPPPYGANTFDGTENHYLVSGGTAVDPGDLEDLIAKLAGKGYSWQNGSTVFIMVNPAEGAVIRNFRFGVTTNGKAAQYDFIPAQGSPALILNNAQGLLGGNQPPNRIQGMTVIGSYNNAIIIEEDYIPVGYMFAFATGGASNAANPVGIREHANPALRGLKLYAGSNGGYPLQDSFYKRGFGTGIRQRGAGAVMQIKASGSYAIPAAYAAA